MTLADAIREGCKTTIKTTGTYYDRRHFTTATCALGAAMVGRYGPTNEISFFAGDIVRTWPELNLVELGTRCPVCDDHRSILFRLITHLNDTHDWPREAIADWLDSLSIDLTPAPVVRERVTAL